MIDPVHEQKIIQRACESGRLSTEDVELLAGDLDRWGPHLTALIDRGLLSPETVAELMAQVAVPLGAPEDSCGAQASGAAPAALPAAPSLDRVQEPGFPLEPHGGDAAGTRLEPRFQILELLGEGGAGRVYRAYEPHLKRCVALKLLRGDDPKRLHRFVHEAQAQARIDHENVCRVYEAGETGGKPYIAMQYIDGESLERKNGGDGGSSLLSELTVENKVRILQRVAEGIQAAHREGLIHRDIKPSNIMIERSEDGDYKPYILDFGLAREVAAAGVTSMGLAVGTPNFMAPEQARGQSRSLDRRTDVYGLGATLYALLAGKPPFEGPSSLDVLVQLTEEDPPPLAGVPQDLAIIVAKCLEKEPAERYDSARALAEDLGRYLDGEPIRGRRTSLAYRLKKKARKHKTLVTVAALSLVTFLTLGALSAKAQLEARERTRLAGVFGQEVKAVESLMRIARLVPPHDIAPEKEIIRRRMASLTARIETLGSAGRGPGAYALGRGHLALKEYDQARAHLESAWEAGYHEPEVAHSLGQAMGLLYRRQLEAAERIRDDGEREAAKRRAERQLREPTLRYLALSRGVEVDAPEYVEALIAFYEKRYDEALERAEAAFRSAPWLYEAKTLQADVHSTRAFERYYAGDREAAVALQDHAAAAYRVASEIGRSDPAPYEGLCKLAFDRMEMEIYGRSRDLEPRFLEGAEACDQALRIDAESPVAHRHTAALHDRMAEYRWRMGQDAGPHLERAIVAAERLLELAPDDEKAHYTLGSVLNSRAMFEAQLGEDPTPSAGRSIEVIEESIRRHPDWDYALLLQGLNYDIIASYQSAHGSDPTASFAQAISFYERAAAVGSGAYAHHNMGFTLWQRASHELRHGDDPSATVHQGIEAFNRSLSIDKDSPGSYRRLGDLHALKAAHELLLGADPRQSLQEAVASHRQGLAIRPESAPMHASLAHAYWLQARFASQQGADPQEPLAEGRRSVHRALQGEGRKDGAYLAQGRLGLTEARWKIGARLSPVAALRGAEEALEECIRLAPHRIEAREALAELHLLRAEWLAKQSIPPGHDLAAGLAAIDEALAINLRAAEALALRGALHLEQAKAASPTERPAVLERARESLEEALAINRNLERTYAPLVDELRRPDLAPQQLATETREGAPSASRDPA